MEPRIEEHDVKLAGFQAVVRLDSNEEPGNVVDVLSELRDRLSERLDRIPDQSPACRLFGYWQFVAEVTRVYFLADPFKTDVQIAVRLNIVSVADAADHFCRDERFDQIIVAGKPAGFFAALQDIIGQNGGYLVAG